MSDGHATNENHASEENENQERRSQSMRVPFEATVEVGSAAGPSFEAHAIDVSEDGMHLKTTYLPEIGQPLTCRFETGPDSSVLASGEVVWRSDEGSGGEFGVRFTDLDDESAAALGKIAVIADEAEKPIDQSGTKVRLHIEGLGSPMRARVKGASRSELTVGSELGFLQVGKELELEDATTGKKRPARIDRVEVEIDPETKIPQLVVSLKYEDVEGSDGRDTEVDVETDGDLESIEHASAQMKGAFARNVAKVTPALLEAVNKMKIAALAYAEKKMKKSEDAAPLRMTAPPPAGALHATGRKVVRDDAANAAPTLEKFPLFLKKAEMHKKKIAIGAAATALVLLVVIGMHKSTPPAPVANGAAVPTEGTPAAPTAPLPGGPVAGDTTMANAANPLAQNGQPMATLSGGAPLAIPPGNITGNMPVDSNNGGNADTSEYTGGDDSAASHRKVNVVPFGNGGPVAHGNVLKIKMDGVIEKI
ncbi:MAG: PilZ domain-containing protein, partial [Polyangiaceae bacterium]